MSLIRFDGSSIRGPSAQLWAGIVDWPSGSVKSAVKQSDFEDFAPYNPDTTDVDGSAGAAAAIDTTQQNGILSLTANAGTNAQIGGGRQIWYTRGDERILCIEARVDQNADANSPQLFVGFFDGANFDDVWASGVIASGSNQDALGLRWNADETIDIVAVDDGTLTVLKDNIGVTLERTDGYAKLGLRCEKITTSTSRLTPVVNGTVYNAGAVNVANTSLPDNPMRPGVATTVAATTPPDIDWDWILSAEK